jgi:4-amino-4-deoxy-L-arabinose transferase-like glycosyltransferase
VTDRGRPFSSSIDWVAIAAIAVIYVVRLDYSPVYLLNDEVFSALQSLSLATTGRSIAGDLLPVFFRGLEFPPGRDPLCVYVTALFLKLLPLSEAALRLPTALVGVADIVLAYLLGRRLWPARYAGLLFALALATTPAHFINSRIAIPTLWSVPWLLGWLLALAHYAETRRLRALAVSILCLAGAAYGYLGTAVVVPLYTLGTLAFLFFGLGERTVRPYAIAAGAGAAGLSLIAYWHLLHPERFRELIDYYVTGSSAMRTGTPLFASGLVPNFAAVQERVTTYWNYFDPSFLFLGGDDSPRYSTGRAGVFLLPAVALLPIGMYRAAVSPGLGRLILYAFLCTPVVAGLTGQVQIQRALPLVLFGALLIAWGAAWLLSHPSLQLRRTAVALCIAGALQFAVFSFDYFGDYRRRSGASRGGNLRGAFEEVVTAEQERTRPIVYLSRNVPNIAEYWRFYSIALGAGDLAERTELVEPLQWSAAPPDGALMVSEALPGRELEALGTWRPRKQIYELDGPFFYVVYEYTAATR